MQKTIPLIDFQPFLEGDISQKEIVAQRFYDALASVGCLYLKNYGFSPDLVTQTFAQSKTFFDLRITEKEKIAMKPMNPGYEKARDEEGKDFREVFHFGPEVNKQNWINQWPESLPEFRNTATKLFQGCQEMSMQLFKALAMALNVPETNFTQVLSDGNCYSFLAHYLPLSLPIKRNQTRAKPHYGSGTFGLIFQDDGKGLKICPHQGEWIDVEPIPGTVVIIMEDLIQRWTNDQLYSTLHQVAIPEEDYYKARSRYSIAFKITPNDDAEIRCVDTCIDDENPCKYPPISVENYYKEWEAKHSNIYSDQLTEQT